MTSRRSGSRTGALLWILAVVLMLGAAVYQRLTGPTNPLRGEVVVDGHSQRYRLLRAEESVRDARIAVRIPEPRITGVEGITGVIHWRRHPTSDPFTSVEMTEEAGEDRLALVAYLPAQPAAGKLEYYVELSWRGETQHVPSASADGEDTVVMRFKDPVPLRLLLSHVILMFLSILIGLRAGLSALAGHENTRRLAWLALAGTTVGGMILGPFVQKYAFGAYWTGFPFGYDLTDNKTLILWLVWVVAVAALAWRKRLDGVGRGVVAAASVVMMVVYLIPHSLRGSELDYTQIDAGASAEEAVGTSGQR